MSAPFSTEIDHSILSESNFTPSTGPKVAGPKAFSCNSQFSESGTFIFSHFKTVLVNRSVQPDSLPEITGTSSNCLWIQDFGTLVDVQTMLTIVSGKGSKLARAALLPKTVVLSKKAVNPRQIRQLSTVYSTCKLPEDVLSSESCEMQSYQTMYKIIKFYTQLMGCA